MDSRYPNRASDLVNPHLGGRRAFTVIELLMLIGVLGVLLAILLPALSQVRVQGRMVNEQNHARQLMIGFLAYANMNEDRVMPGYAPQHFRVLDEHGQLLTGDGLGTAKRRYPLRIAPYLDFDVRALLLDETRSLMEQFPRTEETEHLYKYAVSIAPSLGMNVQWIGGSSSSSDQPPALLPPDHPDFPVWNQLFDMNRYYVRRTGQVRQPEQLIVFASARGQLPQIIGSGGGGAGGTDGNGDSSSTLTAIPAEGYYRINSPYSSEMDTEPRWTDRFHPGAEPSAYGYLSFRYRREAVTAFFDGSVGSMDQYQIRDMRHWSNWATHEEWKLPLKNQ